MKKIVISLIALGLIVPSMAFSLGSRTTATSTSSGDGDWGCVSDLVEGRESAIMGAFSTFVTKMNTALSNRKGALTEAAGLEEKSKRLTARKAAGTAFKNARKAAISTYKADRKKAWSDFRIAVKACNNTKGADREESETGFGDPLI